MDKGPPDSEALYTREAITEAIRNVQKFGSIPQTGQLDVRTAKVSVRKSARVQFPGLSILKNAFFQLLSTPRCGNPDIGDETRRRRKKRFVVGSKGWKKSGITYE